jgi:hypothetical protein
VASPWSSLTGEGAPGRGEGDVHGGELACNTPGVYLSTDNDYGLKHGISLRIMVSMS